MPKCKIRECLKLAPYRQTKNPYCHMHMARFRRHGYFEKKTGSHGLEKLPHEVDAFILENCKDKEDEELTGSLLKMGYQGATIWTVKYRRRKLGIKKYEYGEIKKHKAWIRAQAIKQYGKQCELCSYSKTIDTHHIIPKFAGGSHSIGNLIVICPNCHALITRGFLILRDRKDIPRVRQKIIKSLKRFYKDF